MAQLDEDQIEKEILPFLSLDSRVDLRCIALQHFLGLTGSAEGRTFIASKDIYMKSIINVLQDSQAAIAKDAYLSLINLTTERIICGKILALEMQPGFIEFLIPYVLKADSEFADAACQILSNLSHFEPYAETIIKLMIDQPEDFGFEKLIQVFCRKNYNAKAGLHYLGPFLSNLTQIKEARLQVLDKEHCVIERLLPFTEYSESIIRRGGIIGALKNCCFEEDYHEWLLSEDINILPNLLLPLAGPEEFDEEDTDKLPLDLQYLDPDKTRESDPDIRKMLLESIYQLCSGKKGRLYIKDKNTYVILREMHKWEENEDLITCLEMVIQILIQDEPEPGMENLNKVEIPEDVQKKLDAADEQLKKEAEAEQLKKEAEAEKEKK